MAGRKRDATQQADCFSSIILQPRMNQRELALDAYRRQQRAKALTNGTACDTPDEPYMPNCWGSFFSLGSTDTNLTDGGAASREHESLGEALSLVSSASDASCCTVPSHDPAQRDSLPPFSFPIFPYQSEVPTGFDTCDRTSRQRPTKGSSSFTAASASAAVTALVGTSAAKARTGSTRGQPR